MISSLEKKHFVKETDFHMYIALQVLADADKPLGSWILKEKMEELGGSLSLASVGRLLKELDGLNFTELVRSQGRLLTIKGSRQLEIMENNLERVKIEAEIKDATNAENKEDIIDLLKVRLIIEPEVIRLIAEKASDENIQELADSVGRHHYCLAKGDKTELFSINFHQILSNISCNRFLNSVLKLLIHEELQLEEEFPEIAAKLREAHHLQEHELILTALQNRDAELAVAHTKLHIQKLIDSITD